MKPKLYFVADGWSHDCLAWYFRDPKQRIKAEVGEEIILRLTNMRPDGTCEGEVVNIDVKGVVEQRNDYVYGMFLHCRVSYDGEELMAMVAISNVPQRSDSVKFVPKERKGCGIVRSPILGGLGSGGASVDGFFDVDIGIG